MTADEAWFIPQWPIRCKSASVEILLRYVGPATLTDIMLFASTGEVVAEVPELAPGDKWRIEIRTDGEPGPVEALLDLRAAGGVSRRLMVQAAETGRHAVVSDHPAG